MNAPDVTLIIPTQGRRDSLLAALLSARRQDHPSLEIVVVDDAVDGVDWRQTPELACCLADPRIRVVPFHQGRGCAAAKNAGWRVARGRWLCYLDDDNTCAPDRVSRQLACAEATGSPVVLAAFTVWVGARRRPRQCDCQEFRGDDLLLEAAPDTNVLFHRREDFVGWDEDLGTVDDACLFQALILHYGLRVVPNVPDSLVDYVAHDGSRANLGGKRFRSGQRRLLIRWSRSYSPRARRILLLRSLIALLKYRPGGWLRLAALGCRLLCLGGLREWRVLANATGVKLPIIRRWMIT